MMQTLMIQNDTKWYKWYKNESKHCDNNVCRKIDTRFRSIHIAKIFLFYTVQTTFSHTKKEKKKKKKQGKKRKKKRERERDLFLETFFFVLMCKSKNKYKEIYNPVLPVLD